jgi:hypothetical protein
MKIKAKFIGKSGSMGLEKGLIYYLEVNKNTVSVYSIMFTPYRFITKCPYGSVEAFLNNWVDLS